MKIIISSVILIIAIAVWAIELGAAPYATLHPAAPLSGVISQSLFTSTDGSLPQEDKDFRIGDLHYLDNRTWVVASILPVNKTGNAGTALLVLRQVNGTYQAVLGPGTAFPASSSKSMPADVVIDLRANGALIYKLPGEK